jgi:hypothetical protein
MFDALSQARAADPSLLSASPDEIGAELRTM